VFTGYSFAGFKIDSGPLDTINPVSVNLSAGMNVTVTYVYQAAGQTITIQYQDRNGSTVRAHEQVTGTTIVTGDPFTPTSPQTAVTGYVLVDWRLSSDAAGTWRGNKSPTFTIPAGSVTLELRYGQDGNSNGIEDITVTRVWETSTGRVLTPPGTVTVYVDFPPGVFTQTHGGITGYTYKGYTAKHGLDPVKPLNTTDPPNEPVTEGKKPDGHLYL
jgi:hypothetical protein